MHVDLVRSPARQDATIRPAIAWRCAEVDHAELHAYRLYVVGKRRRRRPQVQAGEVMPTPRRSPQPSVERICEVCGEPFRAYASNVRRGWGKCCCIACRRKFVAIAIARTLQSRANDNAPKKPLDLWAGDFKTRAQRAVLMPKTSWWVVPADQFGPVAAHEYQTRLKHVQNGRTSQINVVD